MAIEDIYGTGDQVDFARKMAEILQKQSKSGMPGASMAMLPGSWMYNVRDITDALSGAQYRDIAGSQDKKLIKDMIKSGGNNQYTGQYGDWLKQNKKKGADVKKLAAANPIAGGKPAETGFIPPFKTAISPGDVNVENELAQWPDDQTIDKVVQRTIDLESGGKIDAINEGGYRGLGQFSPAEEKKYGITEKNWKDEHTQRMALRQKRMNDSKELESYIKRSPTHGEIYLAHQQGVGGATNHLKNPDLPAWYNMYTTGEGKRRKRENGEEAAVNWAINAVKDNLPKGHPYNSEEGVRIIKSGEFTPLWTSKFDDLDNQSDNKMGLGGLPQPDVQQPMMGAGGPQVPGVTQGGPNIGEVDIAQAGGQPVPFESQMGGGVKENRIEIPGYKGPAPPIPYVESQDEILAKMFAGGRRNANEIMEKWQERMKGQSIPVPGGTLVSKPKAGGGGEWTFVPEAAKTPISPDTLYQIPSVNDKGQVEFNPVVPGPMGGGKGASGQPSKAGGPLGAYEDVNKEFSRIRSENETNAKFRSAAGDRVIDTQKKAEAARKVYPQIQEIDSSLKLGSNIPTGPTSPFMVKARQFLDNFTPGWASGLSPGGTKEAEIISKFNALLASQLVSAMSDRGSNFQLDTFLKAQPGILTTIEGSKALADYLRQENKQIMDLGRKANKVRGENALDWDDMVDKHYKNNPIVMEYKGKKITHREINADEDGEKYVKSLSPDVYFMSPVTGKFINNKGQEFPK